MKEILYDALEKMPSDEGEYFSMSGHSYVYVYMAFFLCITFILKCFSVML